MSIQNDQRAYIKDYYLLRKFDLEAAKNGEEICHKSVSSNLKFVDGVDSNNQCVLLYEETNTYVVSSADNLRMKPLAWVEGKPVYKGDVLYVTDGLHKGKSVVANGNLVYNQLLGSFLPIESNSSYENKANIKYLTWNKPKVKKEGWINIYNNGTTHLHDTKENADQGSRNSYGERSNGFVTTVRIEYEV